jgi:hypothetical protein
MVGEQTTIADALAAVFHERPALYDRYRIEKQEAAPTFGAALMARQLDSLYDLTSALMSTLAGIVSAETGDKGALVQQALEDFTAAVRGAFAQAGIAITEKRAVIPPALEAELLRTLLKVAPADPLGKGGVVLAKALRQLRQDLAA